jgi:catechol 2,3-dioxygenase-like lactoylglutathione lyase family enzyme
MKRTILLILAGFAFVGAPAFAADSASNPSAPATAVTKRLPGVEFGFIAINVSDMEKSLAFYKNLLGMTEQFRSESPDNLEIGIDFPSNPVGPHLLLNLVKNRTTPYNHGDAFNRFALFVKDIEGIQKRMAAAGVNMKHMKDLKAHKVKVLFVADPDGYTVELLESYGTSP